VAALLGSTHLRSSATNFSPRRSKPRPRTHHHTLAPQSVWRSPGSPTQPVTRQRTSWAANVRSVWPRRNYPQLSHQGRDCARDLRQARTAPGFYCQQPWDAGPQMPKHETRSAKQVARHKTANLKTATPPEATHPTVASGSHRFGRRAPYRFGGPTLMSVLEVRAIWSPRCAGMGSTGRRPVGSGAPPKRPSRRRQTTRPLRAGAPANPCPVAFGLWRL
jgi:hypothetical protein